MRKGEVSSFLFLVGAALLLVFVYLGVMAVLQVNNTITVHRSDLSQTAATFFAFLNRNKLMVIFALVVIVLAKVLIHAPGHVRF